MKNLPNIFLKMDNQPPSPRHVPCRFWHDTYEMKKRKRQAEKDEKKDEVSENETIPDGFLDDVVSEQTLTPTSPAHLHPFSPQAEEDEEDMISDGEIARALALLQKKPEDTPNMYCELFQI